MKTTLAIIIILIHPLGRIQIADFDNHLWLINPLTVMTNWNNDSHFLLFLFLRPRIMRAISMRCRFAYFSHECGCGCGGKRGDMTRGSKTIENWFVAFGEKREGKRKKRKERKSLIKTHLNRIFKRNMQTSVLKRSCWRNLRKKKNGNVLLRI